jgi:hypothetical protein
MGGFERGTVGWFGVDRPESWPDYQPWRGAPVLIRDPAAGGEQVYPP